MKQFVLTCAAGLFLASGPVNAQQRDNETIEGNGKTVTREVPVSSFSSLKASGVYELKLSQGNTESVKIEADENLQGYFNVRNDGDKLVIDTDKMKNKSLRKHGKMRVYVTFKKLRQLELNTVGNVSSDAALTFDNLKLSSNSVGNIDLAVNAAKIDISNSGVGNLKLRGKATEAVVKNSGVGSLQAGSFVVQDMEIDNSGVGHAEVNAEKDLKVKDSFLGKVKNRGPASVRSMNKVRV